MLREIGLENFKPFASRQTVPLAPITLIYGPNSGGKSSLIQSLMLLRQSVEAAPGDGLGLITQGEYADLGSFKSLIHRHELKRELQISLRYDRVARFAKRVRYGQRPAAHQIRQVTLWFRATASPGSKIKDSSELARTRYQLSGRPALDVSFDRVSESSSRPAFRLADAASLSSYARYGWDLTRRDPEAARVLAEEPSPGQLEMLIDSLRSSVFGGGALLPARYYTSESGLRSAPEAASPDGGSPAVSATREYPLFLGLATEFEEVIRSLSYLGPLRSYPARHYLVLGGTKETVGVRGENTPQIVFRRGDSFRRTIGQWFDKFGIPYELNVEAVGNEVTGQIVVLTLRDRQTRVQVAPSDVGFGIGQLLPIVVEGVVARERILCVEQPEIHLHPRLQAHVGDFLIETSLIGDRQRKEHFGNQWIVETHSEALMTRLQRRVREGRIRPEDVSVVYVEPAKTGSRVIRLNLDKNGDFLDAWPGGFFEESYRESFAGRGM